MPRRRTSDKPAEAGVVKPPTRVPRRKKRRPSGAREAQTLHVSSKPSPRDEREAGYSSPGSEQAPVKMSRAPRPAEPPPSNPNVFSYTFTIWKSS
jgi:hypothetical protein